jgi:hypothetical protein
MQAPKTQLLNVSTYQPGDFKQFYNDPRTRGDYLQWTPLLLEAEEWYAGNRKIEVINDFRLILRGSFRRGPRDTKPNARKYSFQVFLEYPASLTVLAAPPTAK